jgi:Spy/CpxP family protein refolding chaperone
MKATRTFAWLLPLMYGSFVCSGCAHSTAPGATTAPNAAAPTAAAPMETAPMATAPHGWQGERVADPANALLRAADGLELTGAQKATVHSLEEQLEANERDTRAAFMAFRSDLAAQVRSGTIDQTKLQADEGTASTAVQTHVAREADTMNGLHAALDPSQRKAAVEAVRAGQPGRTEMQRGTGTGASAAEEMGKKRLERMTRELGLDTAQQHQVAALIAAQPTPQGHPMEERRRRMDALLTAFEADTFDARTAAPAPPMSPAEMVREGTDRQVAFLSQLMPILRPDQREKLATAMESRGMPGHDDGDD